MCETIEYFSFLIGDCFTWISGQCIFFGNTYFNYIVYSENDYWTNGSPTVEAISFKSNISSREKRIIAMCGVNNFVFDGSVVILTMHVTDVSYFKNSIHTELQRPPTHHYYHSNETIG